MLYGYKEIEGFPNYYINKDGEVISTRSGKAQIIHERLNAYGYPRVSLVHPDGRRVDRLVHRLVAIAFIPNPNNYPQINHIDGDKQNYSLDNLEWCTDKQNKWHSRNILGNTTTDQKPCYLFYKGSYIGEFDSKENAIEYCSKNYGVSKHSLRKYYTSNGCALVLKEAVTTIPKGSRGENVTPRSA